MLEPVRTVAPAVEPVTLAEAKAQLRVDSSDEDALITGLIEMARQHLDGWSGILGRCLIDQTWRLDLDGWPPSGDIRLPFPDVSSVTVVYSDADDAEQTVTGTLYRLLADERGSLVRFRDAFTAPTVNDDRSDAVRVSMVAGFGPAGSDVPADIRRAMMLHIGHLFANREAVIVGTISTALPFSYDTLVTKYRRVGF